jgi:hypothetical protein
MIRNTPPRFRNLFALILGGALTCTPLLPPLYALATDGNPSAVKSKELIEVTLPDGTKQQGFIENGQFIALPGTTPQTAQEKPLEASKLIIQTYPIELSDPKLEKTLNRQYSAYRVVVENQGPNVVDIINGDILNGVSGQEAFLSSKRDVTGNAAGWWLATGLLGAGISASKNKARNQATQAATMGYDKRLPVGPLPVGAQSELRTFVPIGANPQVRVVFKDQATGELLYANK